MRLIDADKILKEIREKAQELSNQHWSDDEQHLMGKGIQCMCVQAENIINTYMENCGDGWIPCSDRLPEKDGFYLTTVVFKGNPSTCRHLFDTDNNEWLDSDYMPFVNDDISEIVAWKPLPEPFDKSDKKLLSDIPIAYRIKEGDVFPNLQVKEVMVNLKNHDFDVLGAYKMDEKEAKKLLGAFANKEWMESGCDKE